MTDLLDLVGNSEKYRERVKVLKEYHEIINRDIGDRNRIAKLDDLLSAAEAKVAEAGRTKVGADKYLGDKKKEGDDYYDQQAARIKAEDNASIKREQAVTAREANVVKCQASLDAKEKDLQARELDVAKATVRAEQMTREANLMQEKYLSRLQAIQTAAAEQ